MMQRNHFRPYFAGDEPGSCAVEFVAALQQAPWTVCDHLRRNLQQLAVRQMGDPTEMRCYSCTLSDARFFDVCECCGDGLPADGSEVTVLFGRDQPFMATGTLCELCFAQVPRDLIAAGIGPLKQ